MYPAKINMTRKHFFDTLAELVNLYKHDGSKLETARISDALYFCRYHADAENYDVDAPAPADHAELESMLLCGAGENARYAFQKWQAFVAGCGPGTLTPDASAIMAHYCTVEQIERHSLSWNSYPPHFENWQEFEASRLHSAADLLAQIAFSMGLFKKNRI